MKERVSKLTYPMIHHYLTMLLMSNCNVIHLWSKDYHCEMQLNKDWKINLYRNGPLIVFAHLRVIHIEFSIFCYEEYLSILSTKFRTPFARFRTSNHHLPIETGRLLCIPINDRRTTLSNSRQIADERRFVLEFQAFSYSIDQIPLHFVNWCNPWK